MSCDYGPLLSLQMYGQLLGWRGAESKRKLVHGKAVAHRLVKALFDVGYMNTKAEAKQFADQLSAECAVSLSRQYNMVFPGEEKRAKAIMTTFLMDEQNNHCPKALRRMLCMQALDPKRMNKKMMLAMSCCGGKKISKFHMNNILLGFTKAKTVADLPTNSEEFQEMKGRFERHFTDPDVNMPLDALHVQQNCTDQLQQMLQGVVLTDVEFKRFLTCLFDSKEEQSIRKELAMTLIKCSCSNPCSKDLCGLLKMRQLNGRESGLGSTSALIACCLKGC